MLKKLGLSPLSSTSSTKAILKFLVMVVAAACGWGGGVLWSVWALIRGWALVYPTYRVDGYSRFGAYNRLNTEGTLAATYIA